jgi:hypothetical protein
VELNLLTCLLILDSTSYDKIPTHGSSRGDIYVILNILLIQVLVYSVNYVHTLVNAVVSHAPNYGDTLRSSQMHNFAFKNYVTIIHQGAIDTKHKKQTI